MLCWGFCFYDNDLFDDSVLYFNFYGIDGLELVMGLLEQDLLLFISGGLMDIVGGLLNFFFDIKFFDYDCEICFGSLLLLLLCVEILFFEFSGDFDLVFFDEYVVWFCEVMMEEGEINWVVLVVDCLLLF